MKPVSARAGILVPLPGRIAGMKIYDLSHPLHAGLPVWPGDWKFSREASSRIRDGEGSNSSNIRTALHFGTHIDAPSHTIEEGMTVDQIDLSVVMGPVRVLSVSNNVIQPEDFRDVFEHHARRVIVRCPGIGSLEKFPELYACPGPAAAKALVGARVLLYGTNAPSVDPIDSVKLEVHRILMSSGMIILENLFLEEVPDGEYELIALPLKISGADGSPVRAVLLER